MKWDVEHVRVTLEDRESGERLIIEQDSEGRVTCATEAESGDENSLATASEAAKVDKAPAGQAAAKESTKAAKKKTAKKTAKRKTAKKAAKKTAKKAAKKTTKKAAKKKTAKKTAAKKTAAKKTAKKTTKENEAKASSKENAPDSGATRGTSLAWKAVRDHGYEGFAASSGAGAGVFKILLTRSNQWALFLEQPGVMPHHHGCFGDLEEAKARAQAIHDDVSQGRVEGVTAGQIAEACPVPEESKEKAAPKSAAKKKAAKKSTAKKTTAKKSTAKKSTAKKSTAKKTTTKNKTTAKDTAEEPPEKATSSREETHDTAARDRELTESFAGAVKIGLSELDEDD